VTNFAAKLAERHMPSPLPEKTPRSVFSGSGAELKLPGRPFEGLPGIGDFMIGAEPAAAAGLPIR
jgi:hypothetical protein